MEGPSLRMLKFSNPLKNMAANGEHKFNIGPNRKNTFWLSLIKGMKLIEPNFSGTDVWKVLHLNWQNFSDLPKNMAASGEHGLIFDPMGKAHFDYVL